MLRLVARFEDREVVVATVTAAYRGSAKSWARDFATRHAVEVVVINEDNFQQEFSTVYS